MNAVDERLVPEYDGTPLILAVGEFDWPQGYDYLLAALARLKQANVAFQARLVGDGPLYAPFRYSIGALDLEADVMLDRANAKTRRWALGSYDRFLIQSGEDIAKQSRSRFREKIIEWPINEIFVLSAHLDSEENRVLLKSALDAGLPVIITDAANAGGLVRDGENGSIIPARDIPALTEALKKPLALSS
ncbi:MAG: hypothetical protein H7175_16365 [Burkholderiales bacterium]|nr:hypothetical protein [Anaerolineae bacterium]